jgi:hypothetical protein
MSASTGPLPEDEFKIILANVYGPQLAAVFLTCGLYGISFLQVSVLFRIWSTGSVGRLIAILTVFCITRGESPNLRVTGRHLSLTSVVKPESA